MMDGNNPVVKKILNVIEFGKLTTEESERRLDNLIEEELKKKDPDMKLVNACVNLMWEMDTHGKIPFENHMEESKQAVLNRFERYKARKK